jgi:hypothetical protein
MQIANAKCAARWCVALTLVALLGRVGPSVAQVQWPNRANDSGKIFPEEVVVTAKRLLTDEQMTEHVEKALKATDSTKAATTARLPTAWCASRPSSVVS